MNEGGWKTQTPGPYEVMVKLKPAPQGMGAPQAAESTQQNDVEGLRSLPRRPRSPLMIHIMSATMAKIKICSKWLAHLFSHLSSVDTGNVGTWYHFVLEKIF